MQNYFSNQERREALLTEARLWVGTPFHPHAKVRGAGVDCVSLPLAIYQAIGFLGESELPVYTMDGGSHLAESALVKFIQGTGRFQRLEPTMSAATGDLLVMKLGRVEHHLGLVLYGSKFLHAVRGQGVLECDLSDPTYLRRITSVYCPVELGVGCNVPISPSSIPHLCPSASSADSPSPK